MKVNLRTFSSKSYLVFFFIKSISSRSCFLFDDECLTDIFLVKLIRDCHTFFICSQFCRDSSIFWLHCINSACNWNQCESICLVDLNLEGCRSFDLSFYKRYTFSFKFWLWTITTISKWSSICCSQLDNVLNFSTITWCCGMVFYPVWFRSICKDKLELSIVLIPSYSIVSTFYHLLSIRRNLRSTVVQCSRRINYQWLWDILDRSKLRCVWKEVIQY